MPLVKSVPWSGTTGVDSCLEYSAHVSGAILRAGRLEADRAVAASLLERSLADNFYYILYHNELKVS